jgi:threonine dehydrogenase-like Zn-dependent dehydrogenase
MRAMIIDRPSHATVRECTAPTPGAGEVLVRLEGCGVCGSNLALWQGQPWFHYPRVPGEPGHEGWGTVAALGSGVTGIALGTRVAILSSRAFAEYDVAAAEEVVVLPETLADRPFPAEALACALNVMARAPVRPGERMAIVGIGFLGASLVSLATQAGAQVTAISRRQFALEVAESQGASALVTLTDFADTVAACLSISAGRGFSTVIEVAGTQSALDVASALVEERGRLVIAGYHQDGPRLIDLQSWNWRGLDVVNAHERDRGRYVEGMRMAVAAVAGGTWNPLSLITDVLPLEDIGHGLSLLAERPRGFLKSVVMS